MTIHAMDGIVIGVYVRRPIQPVLRFKEIVADLLEALKDLGLEPDKGMREDMGKWPADPQNVKGHLFPIPYEKTAILTAFGEVGSVDIKIYPDVDGRWFYLLAIGTNIKATYATEIIDPDSPKQAVAVRGPNVGRLTGEPASTDRRIPLHGVSVSLPGPARDVRGLDVPADLLAGKPGTAQLSRPHALTINRPHSKPLSLLARQTSVTIRGGAVESVTLVRPLLPCYFEKAVADIVDAAEAEGAEPAMVKALTADWTERPGPQEFKTTLRGIFEGLVADVHMKKDVATNGWSYTMTFRATADATNPAAHPKPEPVLPNHPPAAVKRPKTPREAQGLTGLHLVTVHVPGTARQVEGLEVAADQLAGKPGQASIASPHLLAIERENHKPLWLPARATTLTIRDGQVESVTFRRPVNRGPLEKAVADLRGVAKALGLNAWDIDVQTMQWLRRGGAPEFVSRFAGQPQGLDTEIHLKKDGPDENWSYTMTFRTAKAG